MSQLLPRVNPLPALSGRCDAKGRVWICKISEDQEMERKRRMNRSGLQGGAQLLWCMPEDHKWKQAVKEECKQLQSSNFSWAFGELGFNRSNKIPFPAPSHWKSFWHSPGIPVCTSPIHLPQAVPAPHHLPVDSPRQSRPLERDKGSQWAGGRFLPLNRISIPGWEVRGTNIPEILGSQRFSAALVWAENSQGWC